MMRMYSRDIARSCGVTGEREETAGECRSRVIAGGIVFFRRSGEAYEVQKADRRHKTLDECLASNYKE